MKLQQAVSLAASVVTGNSIAPYLPHVGLAPSAVTGVGPELRLSVECTTGVDKPIWVVAKHLLDVLASLGDGVSLKLEKGALLASAPGRGKVKITTYSDGMTCEASKAEDAGQLDGATLLRALTAVLPACDPTNDRAYLRGVLFDQNRIWCATHRGMHLAPLDGARRMPTIGHGAARALVRAIEAAGGGVVVKIARAGGEVEFVVGETRIRSPLIAEECPGALPQYFLDQAPTTHTARILPADLRAAIKVAGLSAVVTSWTKDGGAPSVTMRSDGGRLVVESADAAESECACSGEVASVRTKPRILEEAVASLGAEEVELVTSEEASKAILLRRGDDIRLVMQVSR